jgi:hypothetical protein
MARSNGGTTFREERAARNQSLFREVNERIGDLSGRRGSGLNEFVCECAEETCSELLSMTLDEYETLRQHPAKFAVFAEDQHVWPDVERIVAKNDRYWIVEKLDHAAVIATKLDPRDHEQV